jgi:hypothetical protein
MKNFQSRRFLFLILFSISLVAILLLVIGLPELQFKPGKSLNLIEWFLSELAADNTDDFFEVGPVTPQSDYLPEIGDVLLNSLIVVFWLLAIFTIVSLIVSPKFRRDLFRLLAFMIPFVILLPQIAQRMSLQNQGSEEEGAGQIPFGDFTAPQPPPFVQNPPGWLVLGINTIIVVLLIVGIVYLWRRFQPKPDTKAVVVRESKKALSDLESGLEFRDVVIACYAQMCHGLEQRRKMIRHHAMTPREFEKQLAQAGIASTHIQQLTRMFESVRYGAKQPDKVAEIEAKNCLSSILQVYGN